MLRGYQENRNAKYFKASVKAGDWLVKVQDKSGGWRKHTYNGMMHVYHSRVAWVLLKLFETTGEKKYGKSAIKNLEWALLKQRDNGWFGECAFSSHELPFTHTIAYTARGFLESGLLLNNEKYLKCARKTGDGLLKAFLRDNLLAGSYDQNWRSNDKYSCLTGCAQTAIIWFKLFKLLGDTSYLNGALKVNRFLKSVQNISTDFRPARGGMKGSHPIYGKYLPFSFLNWATKFFVDSLMLEQSIMEEVV